MELKKLKVYKELSEETVAFSCEVFYKGKKVCNARNNGRGGCNHYDVFDKDLFIELQEWARSQEYKGMLMDLDTLIMLEVEEVDFVKNNQYKHWILKNKDGELFTAPILKSKARVNRALIQKNHKVLTINKQRWQREGYEVLNTNI